MGAWYENLSSEDLRNWVLEQKIFWVATAPLSNQGHVNVSPKGRPSFNLVGNNACWYTDMTGSGNETLSHLYEPGNGRITVMFSACKVSPYFLSAECKLTVLSHFTSRLNGGTVEGPARILRLFGKGRVFERSSDEFRQLLPDGDERILPGTRAIIWVDFYKGVLPIDLCSSSATLADMTHTPVSTSCGFAVPYFSYEGERLELDTYYTKLEASSDEIEPTTGLSPKLLEYWSKTNSLSIDTMPGLKLGKDLSIALKPPFETYGSYKAGKVEGLRSGQAIVAKRPQRGLDMGMLLALVIAFVAGIALAPRIQSGVATVRSWS